MRIRTCIVTTVLSILTSVGYCFGYELEEQDWTPAIKGLNPIMDGFSKEIIGDIQVNHAPAKPVLDELAKRSNLLPLMGKALDKKRVSIKYTDATCDEIAAGIVSKVGLKTRLLTDNLVLIDSLIEDADLYRRDNCGDSDCSPPFSIEEQRRERERALALQKQRREAYLEALKEWQSNKTLNQTFEYYPERDNILTIPRGNYLLPPPPIVP